MIPLYLNIILFIGNLLYTANYILITPIDSKICTYYLGLGFGTEIQSRGRDNINITLLSSLSPTIF